MNKDAIRARILETAGATFAAEGYRNATVRKICREAGVNIAAIHYYFGDKQQLYTAAVQYARRLIEQRWPLPSWSSDLSAEQRLRSFVQTFLRRLLNSETSEWQTRLLLREVTDPTRAGDDLVREAFKPLFSVLLEILRDLVPPDLSETELRQIGFSILGQCMFYLAHPRAVKLTVPADERKRDFTTDRLADHVCRFSLAAIQGWSQYASYPEPVIDAAGCGRPRHPLPRTRPK